jgi:hypothetical protein
METNEKIIYSINIEDVQNVAQKSFGRVLNQQELDVVENKLGDYIPWFEFIETAIDNHLNLEKVGDVFDDEE